MPAPHHGGGSRRRGGGHAEHEGEEGSERWLITYADMLTLLLVLFIVLFSISVVNTSKFIALKTSLGSAFGTGTAGILDGGSGLEDNAAQGADGNQLVMPGNPVTPPTTSSGSVIQPSTIQSPAGVDNTAAATKAAVAAEAAKLKAIEKTIAGTLTSKGMRSSVRFAINKRGLVITVVTNALIFPGNSATLLADGQTILKVVADPLAKQTRNIEVDGYTNQEKVSTAPYPSGWELSSARASSVVRYLSSHGVAESRLSAVGFSDQHPLYPASDPRSVTLNRRVEIVVLSSLPASAAAGLQSAGS
jgi:chemotaxis protein MotB